MPSLATAIPGVWRRRAPRAGPAARAPAGRPRIAVYMHDLSGGGAERVSLALMRQFIARGVEVSLLLHADVGELRGLLPPGVSVVRFNRRRTVADLPPLVRYLRQARPDILLAHLHHDNIVALLARMIAGGPTRIIVCQHSILSREVAPPANWKYRILPRTYHLLAPWMTAMVAVSAGSADDAAAQCRLPRARITHLNNPVIDAGFAERAAQPAAHPWFQDSVPVFVSAARLVPQKDHMTLLRGFAAYRRRRRARLFMMGTGPEAEMLRQLASELGIADDVVFGGFVANPLPYIRKAAAFVTTSQFEGFGVSLVEALGCGTPAIATDCPYGPAEILDHGTYGQLIPVGDAAALGEALADDLRQRWPAALLQARAAAFTTERCAAAYLDLFDRVLGGPSEGFVRC